MAKLKISELNPAGSQLFVDPESFLQELEEDELAVVVGGFLKLNLSNLDLKKLRGLSIYGKKSFNFGKYRAQGAVVSGISNSNNNNTVNGQTYNAHSAGNFNTAS